MKSPYREKLLASLGYKPKTAEMLRARGVLGNGLRDRFLKPGAYMFKPVAGENRIRVLPPTWKKPAPGEDPENWSGPAHWGVTIFTHWNVGIDDGAFICLDHTFGKTGECPVCQERPRVEHSNREKANQLRPRKKIAVYVINRDDPTEDVLVWLMPPTLDAELCVKAVDQRTGEVFQLDDPENGYDVIFNKEGFGVDAKYANIGIARRASPISDNPEQAAEWLEYIIENPLPDVLVIHDAERIKKALSSESA